MEDKVKSRIEELKKMKENLLANINAVDGAIIELSNLLSVKKEEVSKDIDLKEAELLNK